MPYLPEPPFKHDSPSRTGVLLVNLGTPDAPTAGAVRRYLAEFLWDPRVVEIPRAAWWLILRVILVVRPAKSAAKYAKIWTKDGSPLRVHLERQVQLLRGFLGERVKSPLAVAGACRYGKPSIAAGIASLRGKGCDRILVLPLYPQYAASTTGSTMDAVGAALSALRNVPAVRTVRRSAIRSTCVVTAPTICQRCISTISWRQKMPIATWITPGACAMRSASTVRARMVSGSCWQPTIPPTIKGSIAITIPVIATSMNSTTISIRISTPMAMNC